MKKQKVLKIGILVLLVTSLCAVSLFGAGQQGKAEVQGEGQFDQIAPGIPRHETLIAQIQAGRSTDPDRFNWWVPPNYKLTTHGFQQGSLDTLWYVGQLNGEWFNSLAAEKPVYNDDFTEMTVKLRKGVYWSDGVEFTAEDVIATVEIQQENPGMAYTDFFNVYVDEVTAPDKYSVHFKLKKPNSRFHVQFVVRWGACYIMPAHVFREVEDPVKFQFNPPISLGPYVIKDYDPNGYWFIWERREDWDRTAVGMVYGKPAPKYLLFVHYGNLAKQTIAQARHELDVSQLWTPEAWESLKKRNEYSIAWYDDFPWACFGDPAAPGMTLNTEVYPLGMRDVRWALALTIDPVSTLMEAYGGAARVTAIHNTPTLPYYEWYYDPLEEWLRDFTLDVAGGFKPYDPSVPIRIAEEAKKRGHNVPSSEEEIRKIFGRGWWKYAPEVAEELLLRNGFKRNNQGKWLTPKGDVWKLSVLTQVPEIWPLQARLGASVAEKWRDFGIETTHEVNDNMAAITNMGEFDSSTTWPVESWGGHPDLYRWLQYMHSDYYKPIGEMALYRNPTRWYSDEMDAIVEEMNTYDAESEKTIELGLEAMKILVEEMPFIPMVGQNQLDPADTYYWENWPTADNPYAYPLPSGGNYRVVLPRLKPTGRK